MGRVFAAQHAILGKRLAIKVLATAVADERVRQRFFHEARAASAIDHEHIVSVLDFGLIPDTRQPYLVMEYVDGESLEDVLQREAPLPLDAAIEVAAQLLSALSVVHGAGLVHRDVKPANIIWVRTSRDRPFIKLLDFGIAGVLDREGWRRRPLTQVKQVVGTPAYLAPEQARGGEVSPQWDLWAASIVLYELLSAELPFEIRSLEKIQCDIAGCRLVPLGEHRPDLPSWVLALMRRAQAPHPQDRFPSATAFLQALEQRGDVGEADQDQRTTPFSRIQLGTPPPELLGVPSVASRSQAVPAKRSNSPDDSARAVETDRPKSTAWESAAWESETVATVAGESETVATVAGGPRGGRKRKDAAAPTCPVPRSDAAEFGTGPPPPQLVGGPVPMPPPDVESASLACSSNDTTVPALPEPTADGGDAPTAAFTRMPLEELGSDAGAAIPLRGDSPRGAGGMDDPMDSADDLRTIVVRKSDPLQIQSSEIPLPSAKRTRLVAAPKRTRPWLLLTIGGVVLLVGAVVTAVLLAW